MKKSEFVKRAVALLFSLAVATFSVSAVEFTLGGKIVGEVHFTEVSVTVGKRTYSDYEGVYGMGASMFLGIDFFSSEIIKLGVRPEVGLYLPVKVEIEFENAQKTNNGLGAVFALRIPFSVTFAITKNVDLGLSVGLAVSEHTGPTFSAFGAFKAGPGKILLDIGSDISSGSNVFYQMVYLGAGYQYTF